MKRFLVGAIFITGMPIFAGSLFLTLEDAKELAVKQNQTILAAQEKLKAQKANVDIARSGFFPSVSFLGSYTRILKIPAFTAPSPHYEFLPLNVYNLLGDQIGYTDPTLIMTGMDTMKLEFGRPESYIFRGSIQQPLFTWGSLWNAYKIASLGYEVEKENYEKKENDIKMQVTRSFLGTILVQKTLKLTEDSYQQMKRHTEQVEILYNNGMVQKLDLLRARVELSNLRTQVVHSKERVEIAFSGLKTLLALPPDTLLVLDDKPIYKPFDITLDEATEYALKKRPDLIGMRLTREMTANALAIERAQNKPKLALIYNYDYKKPVRLMENKWGPDWNVSLALSMPIFSGGSHINKVRQKIAQLNQVDFGLISLENAVRLEVKSNWFKLERGKEIMSYQEENVTRAEEAYRLAEKQYKNGLITNLEYMDTQLALMRARLEQLSSLVNYNIAQEELWTAMGGFKP